VIQAEERSGKATRFMKAKNQWNKMAHCDKGPDRLRNTSRMARKTTGQRSWPVMREERR